MERVKLGIPGLDELLGGGMLPDNVLLVQGAPGTGKTTLGLQFLHYGATELDQPALLVSFEQLAAQIYRDARHFGWSLRELEQAGKFGLASIMPIVLRERLLDSPEVFKEWRPDHGVTRLVIDSVNHLWQVCEDEREARNLLHELVTAVKSEGFIAMMLSELEGEQDGRFEEYLADSVVRLNYEQAPTGQRMRTIEVRKTRGQGHQPGRFAFSLSQRGLQVFARSRAPQRRGPIVKRDLERISTGIGGLDRMLGGGLFAGSSALLAGSVGTGKTLCAMHFLHAGLQRGESGLLVSVEESPERAIAFAQTVGMDLGHWIEAGQLQVVHQVPVAICVDELFWRVEQVVREHQPRRLVLDSISTLFDASGASLPTMVDYVRGLLDFLEHHGITSVLTWGIPEVTGDLRISDIGLSPAVDCIILLRFVETGSEIRRMLGLLKMRGSNHDKELREYAIGDQGIVVESKLVGLSGVLRGSASGTLKQTIEELVQPLTFIRGFTDALQDRDLDDLRRDELLQEMREQTVHVTKLVCEHFDYDYAQIKDVMEPE